MWLKVGHRDAAIPVPGHVMFRYMQRQCELFFAEK
jgi:hypothetical protein